MKKTTSRLPGLLCALLAATLTALVGCAPKVQPTPISAHPPVAAAIPAEAKNWAPLIERLSKDGFDRVMLIALFSKPQLRFDPKPMRTKLNELLRIGYGSELTQKIQQGLNELGYELGKTDGKAGGRTRAAIRNFQEAHGLPADGEPSEAVLQRIQFDLSLPIAQRPKPKPVAAETEDASVYKNVLTPQNLAKSLAFYQQHRELLMQMEKAYGVPAELAVAIFTVETRLGEYLGEGSACVNLASMALSADFERVATHFSDADQGQIAFLKQKARERGDWAYAEFKALLRYAQSNSKDPLAIPGSVYGAIGIGQFMPSNALKFGVDGDGNGLVDLFELTDAVHSFGNYVREHGWQGDMASLEKRRKVLMRYNHSARYVNTVLGVSDHLAKHRR